MSDDGEFPNRETPPDEPRQVRRDILAAAVAALVLLLAMAVVVIGAALSMKAPG